MYLITENEDPPPNVPLSGPLHRLSKSLTKVIQSNHFSYGLHAQSDDIVIVLDGEVLHLYHDSHCITFSRS